jgi:hypothetical protein
MMDEESVGIFGVLLIVTVLVVNQVVFHQGTAAPRLAGINWENVASVFGCDEKPGDSCYLAMSQ